ncbi:Two component transcriptional regulator, LytTR family [Sphingobacterium sp. PM2-P1-29]|nr:Two component transcriptional regulator, LytTR family [Sphingobacterium sp. PM2-P1-29]
MFKQSVLIADRDVSFRQDLRKKIESLDYPAVFHESCNGPEAIRYINSLQPEVVFINASLPGMAGFDVIQKISHDPVCVVVSDRLEDAAKAMDHGALGYLHRPICTENLKRTLIRISSYETAGPVPAGKLARYPSRIFVAKGNSLKKIDTSEITFLRAERDYTRINILSNESFLSNLGIGELSRRLDPDKFLRVHRSFIVNLDHVQGLCRDIKRLMLVLPDNIEINVGKRYVPLIRELIF